MCVECHYLCVVCVSLSVCVLCFCVFMCVGVCVWFGEKGNGKRISFRGNRDRVCLQIISLHLSSVYLIICLFIGNKHHCFILFHFILFNSDIIKWHGNEA